MKAVLVVIVVALVGIAFFCWRYIYVPVADNGATSVGAKNSTYIIEGKKITLVNGIAESSAAPGSGSKIVTKYFGNEVRGDFNADGREDRVFLLTQQNGGSGIFYYVAVALGGEAGYTGTNARFLGDRIAPQSTEFRDWKIIVNYATRKVGEPMTIQPSIGVSKYFKIEGSTLIETSG